MIHSAVIVVMYELITLIAVLAVIDMEKNDPHTESYFLLQWTIISKH
jgi:hypothetical protein